MQPVVPSHSVTYSTQIHSEQDDQLLAEHVHPSLQFDSHLVGNPPCVEHTQKTLITFIVIYSQFIFDRRVNSEINVSFYRSQMQIRLLCTALQLFLCMVFHTPP